MAQQQDSLAQQHEFPGDITCPRLPRRRGPPQHRHEKVGAAFKAGIVGAATDQIVAKQLLQIGLVLERRSEEHTSELQSLMRNSYAVFCLKKKITTQETDTDNHDD